MANHLIVNQTTTGACAKVKRGSKQSTFMAILSNTTTPTATIEIRGSLLQSDTVGVLLGTITLTTAGDVDGFAIDAPWEYVWANVTAISGVSASVNVYMGVSNH